MKNKLLTYFLISFIISISYGKNDSLVGNFWRVSPNIHYGFILKHRPAITRLTYQHTYGVSLDFEKFCSIDHRGWFGVSTVYLDYRNEIIGKEIGVYPFYRFYFNNHSGKNAFKNALRLGMKLGTGIAYFTNKFDRQTNPTNLFISTRFNSIIDLKLFAETNLVEVGLSFTHASNSAFKMPNLGINVISLSAGIKLNTKIKTNRKYYKKDSLPNKGIILEFNNGFREVFPTNGKKYWVNGFSLVGYKNISKSTAFTTGLDYFYDRSLLEERKKDNWEKTPPSISQFGLNLGTEINLGLVSTTFQVGYTIYNPYNLRGKIYSKLGLKYQVYNNIWTGVRLKSNGAKADFLEVNVHYKL